MSARTWQEMERGLLGAACGLVLLFQLMASALAGSSHLAVKFSAGEISLTEICGTTLDSKGAPAAHIEGVNTCCVWAKSVALAPLMPPVLSATAPARTDTATVTFIGQSVAFPAAELEGPPRATGPPLNG
ncbi:MAG: hypothetical protein LCH80_16470 [Proteobacteria bacterium]|nr:hypothetical protein [Pseudomonadota bacterium]